MGRIEYLEWLRAIAIVAVVVIHITAPFAKELTPPNILIIPNVISRAAVPLFFMISGVLFLNPQKDISIKAVWCKYIARMIKAFIIFSILYAFVDVSMVEGSTMTRIKIFLVKSINGHYHLWYLYAIMGVYAIVPIIRKIASSVIELRYTLLISFIFISLVPFVQTVLHDNDVVKNLTGDISLYIPTWILYLLIGYCLHNDIVKLPSNKLLIGILFLSCAIMVGAEWMHIGRYTISDKMVISSYTSPFTVIYAVSIFGLAKRLKISCGKILLPLASSSFGIYLIHDLFIIICNNLISHYSLEIEPLLRVVIMTTTVLFASFISVKLLKKTSFFNNII